MTEKINVERVAERNPNVDLGVLEKVRVTLRKIRALRGPKRYGLRIPFTWMPRSRTPTNR